MSPKRKKILSLFLVFSLLVLSSNLYANEKRGTKLKIWGKDKLIEGELITVKQNPLLLLDAEGKDEFIDISDIRFIEMKKSKISKGALIGFISVAGTILGLSLLLIPVLEDASFGDVFRAIAILGGWRVNWRDYWCVYKR